MEKALLSTVVPELTARIFKPVVVPATLGVPVMAPVVAEIDKPAGKDPTAE